jgi:hypothetical protein
MAPLLDRGYQGGGRPGFPAVRRERPIMRQVLKLAMTCSTTRRNRAMAVLNSFAQSRSPRCRGFRSEVYGYRARPFRLTERCAAVAGLVRPGRGRPRP